MSRYINADHYAERLRQLRLAYSGAAWQSAIDTALRILEIAPGWKRTDVTDAQWLDHLHMDDDAERINIVKVRLSEHFGRYAAEHGLISFKDTCPCGSGRVLEIHAAFLTPTSPVFKEPQEVSEDGTD